MEVHISNLIKPSWTALDQLDAWRVIFFLDRIKESLKKSNYSTYGYSVRGLLSLCFRSKKNYKKCTPDQLVDIYNDPSLFFHKPLTSFYTKKVKAGSTRLYAPLDDVENITFSHFKYLDGAFTALLVTEHMKQTDQLQAATDKFIATLFTDKTGFDKTKVEQYAGRIKLMPFQVSLLVIAYANIRAAMMSRCPHLFPKVDDDEKTTPYEPTYTGQMWHNLHMEIAETPAFQGYENVSNANVYDVLDYLEKKQIDYLKQKSKQ